MDSNEKSLANISFINKDFESLWNELLALVPKLTRKWDPSQANESDPLAVLLKLIAIAQDKANYNIDKNILELYPLSLTQKTSAFNVYDSLGYTMQWYRSGNGSVSLLYQGDGSITVPRFSQLSNNDSSVVFTITSNDIEFSKSNPQSTATIIQGKCIDFLVNGKSVITSTNLDANNRLYFIEPNVAQNGIFIQLNNEKEWKISNDWKKVTNLSQAERGTRCYEFGVDPLTNSSYIQFPEDIGSLIGSGLKIKYIVSDGVRGNVLAKTITQFYNDLKLSGDITANDVFSVANFSPITDGADPADLDDMYSEYKRTTNIVDTLITLLDYKEYLRTYTTDNKDIVSNVQVSDRTNDLYTSHIVKTLTTDYKFSDVLNTGLAAYDLRLYPLNSSSDTTSRLGYDNTFTYPTKESMNKIIGATSHVKSINHDFDSQGYPVILTYDLAGQIYLESRVTAQEASEIRNNVLTALYKTLNAYEVDFGEAPDYRKIVETITNADKRIQYVALSPLDNYTLLKSSDSSIQAEFDKVDVVKRSILAGKTPWAVKRDEANSKTVSNAYQTAINVSLGQTAGPIAKLCPAGSTVHDYTSSVDITAGVFFKTADTTDLTYKPTILEIGPNEHINFFTPQLKTDVTYTNYLFYSVKLSDGTTIPANTPYTLAANETINFYETKGDVKNNNTYATLGEGDIIVANFDLTSTKDGDYPSLTTKNTISKQSYVESSSWEKGDAIYCSSQSVYDNIMRSSGAFTLLSGEYIIYLKGTSGSFIIYGEGTDVSTGSGFESSDFSGYKHATSTDLAYYQESGSVDSLLSYFVPIPQEKDKLTFTANTILTFGEGYRLRFMPDGSKEPADDFWSTKLGNAIKVDDMYPRTQPGDISSSEGKLEYQSLSDSTWTPFPPIMTNKTWKMTFSVALYASPAQEQTYYQFTTAAAITDAEKKKYVKHSQALTYLPSGTGTTRKILYTGETIPDKTYSVSSSEVLASANGQLPVDAAVELYAFTVKNTSLYTLKNKFASPDTLGVTEITLPSVDGVYFILPYIKAENTTKVSYLLCRPGTVVNLAGYAMIGNITSILNSSYYYKGTAYAKVSTLLPSGTSTKELTTTELYDDYFTPLYVPSLNEEILNPTNPESFFNQNHVMNRYSIAKIGNTDSLVISSLSIQ